jgi:glycosyltransferase involved in cell wall biosynthesis/GT2 family glycosyltransferase
MTRLTIRTCIVTADITGPIRNGGIGSAYYSLARLLADAGHEVTVLYALGQHSEQHPIRHWVKWYRTRGIEFVPLPAPAGPELKGSFYIKTAWAVYEWLKTRSFDIVHFHEWRGIGFYALSAKRQGLCLQTAVTVVGSHSPTLWHQEGMRELPRGGDDVELDFIERESVALADVLWSPSQHMVEWMQSHGWVLPRKRFLHQYVMLERSKRYPSLRQIEELCFFGRLETRKGLDLFCAAVNLLVRQGKQPGRVTLLGKVATVDGVDSAEYVARQAADWPMPWQIISTLDRTGAMEYLNGPGRLAVLPSRLDNLPYTVLECLGAGVPFVTSTTGGIPEMVHPADHVATLFELRPDSLATTLGLALTEGIAPARFRISPEVTDRGWLRFHDRLAEHARTPRRAPCARKPFVSICVTHRDRPELLKQALDSIRQQTYKHFEVVLVDDGSVRPETHAALDRLEPIFARRGWTIVRHDINRYPGAARNTAAKHARGEYLLFMDDDNCAKPHELQTFVSAAQASRADIVSCFLDVFQSNDAPNGKPALYRWPFVGGSLGLGMLRNCFGDTNSLVRAKVYRALGGMTEDHGTGCEDWEFMAKAAVRGFRITVVPEALVWYRHSPTGVQNSTPVVANRLRALRPYLESMPGGLRAALPLCREEVVVQHVDRPVHHADVPKVLDARHVRTVAIFGAGEGGRLASRLARRCGWEVSYIVDNNQTLWGSQAHGFEVRTPEALAERDVDFVLVASMAGRLPLSKQLDEAGLSYGSSYGFFLDRYAIDNIQIQLTI